MRRCQTLVLANGMLVLGVLLFVASHPRGSGEFLVFSPGWLGFPSAFDIVSNAEGTIVAADAADSVAIGQSSDPRFVDKLYQAGALLVWRAPWFAACMTAGSKVEKRS